MIVLEKDQVEAKEMAAVCAKVCARRPRSHPRVHAGADGLLQEEALCQAETAEVQALKNDCQKDLDLALPALQSAIEVRARALACSCSHGRVRRRSTR